MVIIDSFISNRDTAYETMERKYGEKHLFLRKGIDQIVASELGGNLNEEVLGEAMDNLIRYQASEKRASRETMLADEAVGLMSDIVGSRSIGCFHNKDITRGGMGNSAAKSLKNILLKPYRMVKNHIKNKKLGN